MKFRTTIKLEQSRTTDITITLNRGLRLQHFSLSDIEHENKLFKDHCTVFVPKGNKIPYGKRFKEMGSVHKQLNT